MQASARIPTCQSVRRAPRSVWRTHHRHDLRRGPRLNAADSPEAESLVKRDVARVRRFQIRGQPLAVAPLRSLIDGRNTLSQLERQAEDLERRNERLEARIEQLNDPTYLERLARECLGMVRPGETAFVMVPKHGPPPATRC